MSLSKRKIWTINIAVTLTVTVLMFIFWTDLMILFGDFMQKINRPLSSMTYTPLDILIFSCIPAWTYPLYYKRKNLTGKWILTTNLIALLTVTVTFIIGLILIALFGVKPSPWLPDYIIFVPFPYFQTVTFIIGIALTYLVFFIINRKKQKVLDNAT
jgi:hypothetical protein